MVANLGMSGRVLAIGVWTCLLIAITLTMGDQVHAGDEDFYGVEGRPVALNVTVDPAFVKLFMSAQV